MGSRLDDDDYRKILEFRSSIRRFLHWSERMATEAGITSTQHQLLLAIKGSDPSGITIGQVAEILLLRHHSAVELVDRAETSRLVRRIEDPVDRRIVRVVLTKEGESALEEVTLANFDELMRLGPRLARLLEQVSAED